MCVEQHPDCLMLEMMMRPWLTIETSYVGECDWQFHVYLRVYKSVDNIMFIFWAHPSCMLLYKAFAASITISSVLTSGLQQTLDGRHFLALFRNYGLWMQLFPSHSTWSRIGASTNNMVTMPCSIEVPPAVPISTIAIPWFSNPLISFSFRPASTMSGSRLEHDDSS